MRFPKTLPCAWLLAMLALLPASAGTAQQLLRRQIDSMRSRLTQALPDTARCRLLSLLGRSYLSRAPDSGLFWGKLSLALARHIGWEKGEALAFYCMGANSWGKLDYVGAIRYYYKALKFFRKSGDESHNGGIHISIGDIYQTQSDLRQALAEYKEAYALFARRGDTAGLVSCLDHMAYAYREAADYKRALGYYHAVIALYGHVQPQEPLAVYNHLENLRFVQQKAGNEDSASYYLWAKYRAARQVADSISLGATLTDIANYFMARKDEQKALRYCDKAIALCRRQDIRGLLSKALALKGAIYLYKAQQSGEKSRSALLYASRSYLYQARSYWDSYSAFWGVETAQLYQSLYEAELLSGNPTRAAQYFQQFLALHDSARSNEKQRGILAQALQYTFERKQDSMAVKRQLEQSRLRAAVQSERAARLQAHNQLLLAVVGLLLLGGGGLAYFFRARGRERELKMQLAHRETTAALQEAVANARANSEMLKALRAQMNPHFIFNCLNSVNLLTEQHNNAAASAYLVKFSRLMRNLLQSSEVERTPLSEELYNLRLYLEMESLRFKEKLHWNMEVAPDLDADYTLIPPMLLQPYVENAIWHGLMQKPEGGTIHIRAQRENETLVLTIEDDGIGREQASRLKSKSSVAHKSYGTQATAARIALLNQTDNLRAQVTITDLYDTDGIAAGTRVTIALPL